MHGVWIKFVHFFAVTVLPVHSDSVGVKTTLLFLFSGQMCVHLAAIGGHVDVLRHLIWFGANINARVSIAVVLYCVVLKHNWS